MYSSVTTIRTARQARTQAPRPGALFLPRYKNLFPNAKIGFGEWGYSTKKLTGSTLTTLLNQGYGMDPYPLPFSANWVSGVFFWEWGDTAVPYNSSPGSVWEVVNTDMQGQP